jgi:hypothetical protein
VFLRAAFPEIADAAGYFEFSAEIVYRRSFLSAKSAGEFGPQISFTKRGLASMSKQFLTRIARFTFATCSLAACVVFTSCEPSPSHTIPNLPSVVSSLKTAKDTSEDRASMVKGAPKIRFRFRRNGESLYSDARAKHNAAIAWMNAALSQGSANLNELRALLSEADAARIEFHDWYDGPARREGVATCGTCGVSVGLLVDIADLIITIVQMQNEITFRQRQEIQQQLRACEWSPWAQLPEAN